MEDGPVTTTRPPRVLTAATLGLMLVAVLGVAAWTILPPRQTDDVAVPPANASAEDVALAYMAALDGHDCTTARELWVEDTDDGADLWCKDVASLGNPRVTSVRPDRGEGDRASQEVVNMGVSFVLDWRWLHNDGSFPEGKATWGYLMVRDNPAAPWRIFDEGDG
jgi:hypothetical protein